MTTAAGTDDKHLKESAFEPKEPAFEPEARYCEDCEMWLNGLDQWWNHLYGKKHKKNATSAPPKRQHGKAWGKHCALVAR